jgi:solute carrier family 25 oxoglutarate transporter 11
MLLQVKVHIQLQDSASKRGPFTVASKILAEGRFLDLYSGLSAGLLRQCLYTTARMGLFDTMMQNVNASYKESNKQVTIVERGAAGLAAGGLAAVIGNPADLALIRMQSDKMLPLDQRKNYRSVFDALARIVRSEGLFSLWNGCLPTVTRAMALNFGQLAFFSEAREQLTKHNLASGAMVPLTASAIAGFFASFFSLPFDFVKTRLQKQTRRPDGTVQYKGSLDCARQVLQQEGFLRFYRGFSTYYVRIAPHAMITLLVADYLGFITK